MTISAHPLLMSRLEPWLDRKLPLDGWLSGNVTASGTPGALSTTGRVTLVPVGYGSVPSTADFQGVLHAGTDPGATNLHMQLDPLNFGLVSLVLPGLDLPRSGNATLDLSGRVDSGVRMVLNVREGEGSDSASSVWVRGSFRRTQGGWTTDLRSELSPLALGSVASLRPDLKLGGTVRGSLQAVGPLDGLRLTGNLEAGGGTAQLDGTADVRDLASGYRVDATLADVRVSDLVRRLPAPTTWSGRLRLQGRGLSPDSAELSASVEVGRSRVGGMHVDTLVMRLRASGGTLGIDTVVADLGGLKLAGAGRLGLSPASEGEADFHFSSDSLIGLRSILMGDTVIARDTLSALERELLRFQGVNPDALPDTADVAMSGSLEGRARIGGSIHSLDVEGSAVLRSGVYRTNRVDSVTADITAHGLRSDSETVRFSADASGVEAFDRTFEGVHLEGTVSNGAGQGAVEVRRRAGEVYATSGSFALDSVGGSVELQEASAVFDSVTWRMEGPTRIAWDSAAVSIDSLHVARAGTEPMKVTATGTLSRAGDSDFHLDASNVRLARLARMAQLESLDLGGLLDLTVDVTGPASAPLMHGSLVVREPRYGDLRLTRVGGEISYRDRAADLQLEAWSPARKVLTVAGTVPIDLALTRQPRRTLATPMDVSVRADSLDAAVALSYFSMLQDVEGTVSGDFRVRGTVDRPEPSGVLELQNAAWSIEPIGVRHSNVNGRLTLNPDRTVNVQVSTRATGTSDVTGTLTLEPVSDPTLDLKIHFAGFQAVNRRDVAGKISGDLTLTGTYRKPAVGGSLTVDQGTLYLEEFARSAEVVDLTDPDVFNVVDTTILSSRPILADLRNPFLENLRVSIDLSVPRDTWLRSEDMNVEIGGELIVTYDRLKRDLVMVGELNALRGSYTVLGRRFDVQSGTVGFIGTPGINPTLSIQAVSRIRRVGNDPLSVTATVSGTLTQPRVSLSTDEQAVPQSDLVSYLVFGRPAHELSSGQNALVQGATGGAVSYLVGTAATQLSTAVAQKIGVDYLSISQADYEAGNVGILSAAIQNPQVEIGQYLSQNVFVVVVLRRPAEGGSSTSWLGGARIELALSDNYNAEGFVEDRFLRTGSPGFGELGQNSQVLGVFVYREWGY
jgi:autotransporter translocation and assembly factor TamB